MTFTTKEDTMKLGTRITSVLAAALAALALASVAQAGYYQENRILSPGMAAVTATRYSQYAAILAPTCDATRFLGVVTAFQRYPVTALLGSAFWFAGLSNACEMKQAYAGVAASLLQFSTRGNVGYAVWVDKEVRRFAPDICHQWIWVAGQWLVGRVLSPLRLGGGRC